MAELLKKVIAIVEKETGENISTINLDDDLREQVNLDSMQFVAIIAHIEEELQVEVPMEAMSIRTMNEFLDILRTVLENK